MKPAVFILMTVPVGVITKKIINTGLKLHFNSATCSNAHSVQMVRWDNDTFFRFLQNRKNLKSKNFSRL